MVPNTAFEPYIQRFNVNDVICRATSVADDVIESDVAKFQNYLTVTKLICYSCA